MTLILGSLLALPADIKLGWKCQAASAQNPLLVKIHELGQKSF
jgi:hypothetical protein